MEVPYCRQLLVKKKPLQSFQLKSKYSPPSPKKTYEYVYSEWLLTSKMTTYIVMIVWYDEIYVKA